jgi:predicted small secreted protein
MKSTRPFFLILVASLVVGLAACGNTIRGAGRDMQQTGDAISDTVEGNP